MRTLAGWTKDLHRRNLAPSTIARYRDDALTWLTWAPAEPTGDDVHAFLDARRNHQGGPLGERRRYAWISTLHSYYQYAVRAGYAPADPTDGMIRPKLHPGLPRPIRSEDLTVALDSAAPMMRAWLALAAYGGLRCAEIAGLMADGINERDMLLRVLGKGGKERIVPLHPYALDALRAGGMRTHGNVFRIDGASVTAFRVSANGNAHLRACGVDATMHQLRHWFGSMVYAASGGDLRVVQELLGHSSPTTTAIYTAWSQPKARDAVLGLPEQPAA